MSARFTLLSVLCLSCHLALAYPSGAGELPGLKESRAGELWTLTFPLRGPVEAVIPMTGRGLALLVGEESSPAQRDNGTSRLLFLGLRPEPRMLDLGGGFSVDKDLLDKADLDGDRSEELLLSRDGMIYLVRAVPDTEPRALLKGDLRGLVPGALALAAVGKVELLRTADDGTLAVESTFSLPVVAEPDVRALRLVSPRVTGLTGDDGSVDLFAAGPQPHGRLRLQTVLLDPRQKSDEAPPEAWHRLPGPEEVQQASYVRLGPHPLLVVTTRNAEKLEILGHLGVRVFPVTADQSRSGRSALLKAESACRLWQRFTAHAADVDGDGREDLVLLQEAGMGSNRLVIDAYRGKGDGGLFGQPRRTELKISDYRDWHYGDDFTGDGYPDLVTLSPGKVEIRASLAHEARQGVVNKKPAYGVDLEVVSPKQAVEISVGPGEAEGKKREAARFNRLRVSDLDGDGQAEIIIVAQSEEDRGRVVVLRPFGSDTLNQ